MPVGRWENRCIIITTKSHQYSVATPGDFVTLVQLGLLFVAQLYPIPCITANCGARGVSSLSAI